MVLAGIRNAGLRRVAKMLFSKLRLLSPTCHGDSSLPQPQQAAWSSKLHKLPASTSPRNTSESTHICRSAPSQSPDYSVLSYSSAQPYSAQQLAELRENARDTIVALSSGSGRAGVAVIRISGPRAGKSSLLGTRFVLRPSVIHPA